jgi:hypothetical protein
MKILNSLNYGFWVSVLASGIILKNLPVDDTKFALSKLGAALQSDTRLRDQVAEHCATLEAKSATLVEKVILERLPVPTRPEGGPACTLVAQNAKSTRFELRSFWSFRFQIRSEAGSPEIDRDLFFDFPRPLVLFPLAIFLLALVFEFHRWGIGWTLVTYLLLLAGGSPIGLSNAFLASARDTFSVEQPWVGFFLILAWVALCRGAETTPRVAAKKELLPKRLSRLSLFGIGLWNPSAFTLIGPLLLPFRGSLQRLAPFFTLQVIAVAMSLYLLSLDFGHLSSFATKSLFIPRYFTFGLLLFMYLEYRRPRFEALVWEFPYFLRTLLLVLGIEIATHYFAFWAGTSTLTRIGIGLVAGQMLSSTKRNWPRVGREFLKGSGVLLLCATVSSLSTFLSATDLVLRLVDPRIHPSATSLFTFLCGIGLGFLSGSFSVAYFALTLVLMNASPDPLVRAAHLDGVLAGILISPFSLLNWVPAAQFRLGIRRVVIHRFKQLSFPLLIGLVIYALGAINSVAILRPATFVFLCLVAVVVKLRDGSWKLGSYTISPNLRSGES